MPKPKKGSTATVAEVAATHIAETTAPVAETTAPASTEQTEQKIVLVDEVLNSELASWSKSETRDGAETVKFAIENMVKAAECRMNVGDRFNTFSSKHSEDKVRILIKATAKLGINGLSENNITLWRIRAREFPKYFPNPLDRKFVLAMTGGEGIIVRDEAFDKKDKDGKPLPKPYILAPFYAQALDKQGKLDAAITNEDAAEKHARLVVATAKGLRSQAQNAPADQRLRESFKAFRKRIKAALEVHESLVWEEMYKTIRELSQATTNYDHFEALIGKLDKLMNAEENGQQRKTGTAA